MLLPVCGPWPGVRGAALTRMCGHACAVEDNLMYESRDVKIGWDFYHAALLVGTRADACVCTCVCALRCWSARRHVSMRA